MPSKFKKNDRVRHRTHGMGTVKKIDKKYGIVDVIFDNSVKREIFMKMPVLTLANPGMEIESVEEEEKREFEKTYAEPDPKDAHEHLSKLSLFTDNLEEFLKSKVLEAVQNGKRFPCWADNHSSTYLLQPDDDKSVNLTWPDLFKGIMLVVKSANESQKDELVSVY
ncbi:MAG: hypothetical protein ACRENO_01110, partial [Thermodesulfobacteriota bacterium]